MNQRVFRMSAVRGMLVLLLVLAAVPWLLQLRPDAVVEAAALSLDDPAMTGSYTLQVAPTVYLNEIVVSTTSTDWEFFEVSGAASTDLSTLSLLEVASGGAIDTVLSLSGESIPADGFWTGMSPAAATQFGFSGDFAIGDNTFGNSSRTYLLVHNFTGASGNDIDTNNDGVIDNAPWDAIVDRVAIIDDDSPVTYGPPSVGPDGTFLASGGYRCPDSTGTWNMHAFASSADMTPGTANACPTPPPTVYLNEIVVSTTSTDWEFFEISGAASTDLSTLSLLEVASGGAIDTVLSLSGESIPADGFWTGMSPAAAAQFGFSGDFAIGDNTFGNSSRTYLLVHNFTGASGNDIDTNNDGVIDNAPWDAIVDRVAIIDDDSPVTYGPPSVGPDGTFLAAGGYRCPDSTGTWNMHAFDSSADMTPGTANACVADAPPQVSGTTPANGASGVSTGTTITINFTENVNVSASGVTLECPAGTPVAFTGLPVSNANSAVLTPSAALPAGVTCTVTAVASQIADLDGSPDQLDGNGDGTGGDNYSFTFTTAASVATNIIINELDADTPSTDQLEFVELYDGGSGSTALDGLVIVFYNGSSDTSYAAFDLDGYSTDASGYFVLGNAAVAGVDLTFADNFLQNGADAAALYVGNAADFPNGTALTIANLLDAIVYDTNDADDAGLLVLLLAGGQVNESGGAAGSANDSSQRCPNGSGGQRITSTYLQNTPTPGVTNNCVVATIDLSLTKTVDDPNPDEGDPLTFTVTVTNNAASLASATSIVVQDYLPDTTTQIENVANDCGATLGGNTLTWNVGTLAPGANATCNITADVRTGTDGTSFNNYAEVFSVAENDSDSQPGNFGGTPAQDDEAGVTIQVGLPGVCGDAATLISAVQGSGAASPITGSVVTIEGVVVGDHQQTGATNNLRGFFLQEEAADYDADPATSEGVFVYDTTFGVDVNEGDRVRVTGTVAEFSDLTEITTVTDVVLCGTAATTPATVTLPVAAVGDLERFEGMLVTIPTTLTVTENYQLSRYGEAILAANGRQYQFTHLNAPSVAGYAAHLADIARYRITLDDYQTIQNPDPMIHPYPALSAANTLRSGTTITNLTGVMHYAFGVYRIQPQVTNPVNTWTNANPRTATPPPLTGSLKVASFNVLNYFTTIDTGALICGPVGGMDCRGADSASEFTRQRDKIIAAMVAMDADIVGLMEIENNATAAVQDLVDGINAVAGAGTYTYIDTGTIGTDAIKVALIYKPATVAPLGAFAILDTSVDPRFLDDKNRPTLAQSFTELATGEVLTVAVNHLKSKGSDCLDVSDPDLNDGQGNCNVTRTNAALAMVDWLATDPTGSGDPDFLIIGDLNSYAAEDPITAIRAGGYVNLVSQFGGAGAYSYVFDGQSGNLDHALASASLEPQVFGTAEWHINTDEPSALDYNEEFKSPGQVVSFYAPDPYRASDHDPVIVSLNLGEERPPDIEPTPEPSDQGGAEIGVFDPALSKVGLLQEGGVGLVGEQLTWVVTVTNLGTGTGSDIVISDTLRDELRIDTVTTERGSFAINGQTVTFYVPWLNPGESVQMTIVTTVLRSPLGGLVDNTATLSGVDALGNAVSDSETATVSLATTLPATGYAPQDDSADTTWVWLVLVAGAVLAIASGSLVLRRRLH